MAPRQRQVQKRFVAPGPFLLCSHRESRTRLVLCREIFESRFADIHDHAQDRTCEIEWRLVHIRDRRACIATDIEPFVDGEVAGHLLLETALCNVLFPEAKCRTASSAELALLVDFNLGRRRQGGCLWQARQSLSRFTSGPAAENDLCRRGRCCVRQHHSLRRAVVPIWFLWPYSTSVQEARNFATSGSRPPPSVMPISRVGPYAPAGAE